MKPITDILRGIRKGRAVDEATRQFQDVVNAVCATRKPGSITITLQVKPQKDDQEQVIIAAGITCKVPKMAIPDSVWFVDTSGDLHRQDPTQREMFAEAGDDDEEAPAPRRLS